MPHLDVLPITQEQRPALENLFQLYVHDFSEHWAGAPRGELGEDGRFERYDFDPYWRDPGCLAFFLRADGRLAGFALVNAASHVSQKVDRNVAEFFVARKHRRDGLGLRAAHELFSRYPGQWETAIARPNLAALRFWRRAIDRYPRAGAIEEHDVVSPAWNGPVIRFEVSV